LYEKWYEERGTSETEERRRIVEKAAQIAPGGGADRMAWGGTVVTAAVRGRRPETRGVRILTPGGRKRHPLI